MTIGDYMDSNEIIYRRLHNTGLIEKIDNFDSLITRAFGIQSQYYNHAIFNIYNRLNNSRGKDINEFKKRHEMILGWGQRDTLHIYNIRTWKRINGFLMPNTWVKKNFDKKSMNIDLEKENFHCLTNRKDILMNDLKKKYEDRWKLVFEWSALFVELSRNSEIYLKFNEKEEKKVCYNLDHSTECFSKNEIAYLFFEFYGPATIDDLCHFFDTTKKFWNNELDLKRLEKFEFEGDTFYYKKHELKQRDPNAMNITLLGKFDPLLVAYARKDILVPKKYHKIVWGAGGQISPILFVNENFAGKWSFRLSVNSIRFDISVLEAYMTEESRAKIEIILKNFSNWMVRRKIIFNWSLLDI